MKNILYISFGILFFASIFMGCEKEDEYPFEIEGATILTTQVGFFDFFAIETSTMDFNVDFIGEGISSVEMYKTYNRPEAIVANSTAPSGFDTIPGFSMGPILHTTFTQLPQALNITAAQAIEGFGMTVDDIQLGDSFVFTFDNVQTSSGTYPSQEVVTANVACPSDLAGEYTVTTTYGYHDFLPDYNPNTLDVVEIKQVGTGRYEVFDFSGGLYSEGPYVAAYNTVDFKVEFSEVCNDILWEGQGDPWGEVVPLPNGVNSVDPATGIITISWLCNAYGENGVSIYTPL